MPLPTIIIIMNITVKKLNSGNAYYMLQFNTVMEILNFINENKLINNLKLVPQHILSKIEEIVSSNNNTSMYLFKRTIKRLFASNLKTIQYWIDRGYSLTEAKVNISDHQKQQSAKLVKKRRENLNFSKECSCKSVDFWLKKGFSKEEAVQKISESQKTFSLEKCISKYGQEEGFKKWEERQKKWIQTLYSKSNEELENINKRKGCNKERLVEKYGEEKANEICKSKAVTYNIMLNKHGKERADEWLQAIICRVNLNPRKVSKSSIKFIEELFKFEFKDKCHVLHGSSELCLKNSDKKFYLFDFAINLPENKKIIEFHGDYIHMNPKKYKKSYFNELQKITAEEKWKKDEHKQKTAENAGFLYLVVWESDFKQNKAKTLQHCLNFLNE